MVKSVKRTAGIWALAGLLGAIAYSEIKGKFGDERNYTKEQIRTSVERGLQDIVRGEVPDGPVYDSKTLPSTNCSRYIRLSAKDLFGKNYPSGDAWDLRDKEGVEEIRVNSYEDLKKLFGSGHLKQGMVLGIYNPKSRYNSRAEKSGAGYTHVALFLGEKNGELYFADQFGSQIRTKMSDSDLKRKGLEPREVLFLDK